MTAGRRGRRPPRGLTRRVLLLRAAALSGALAWRGAGRAAESPPPRAAEVCILGSGPAGALLAGALARRGIAVLLLESGPAPGQPRAARLAELDAYTRAGTIAYDVAATRFRGAGGTSNLWTGTCPRLHPLDFEPHAYTPAGAPWPIRYGDLEPYYLPAEVELQVRGVDGAAHAPPRRQAFPRPLAATFRNLAEVQHRSGASLALAPLPYSDVRGQPLRIADRHLPELAAAPQATLAAGLTATRLVCAADGRVEGVRLESLVAPPRTARARYYVVACGGVESARLLLLSRCAAAPDGLGNRSNQLGRNFQDHPVVVIGTGSLAGDWPGRRPERATSEQFLVDAKRQGLGGVRIRVTAVPAPDDPLRLDLEVRGEIEMEPSPRNRFTLSDERRDAFGNPGVRLEFDFSDNDRRTMRHAEELVRRVLADWRVANIRIDPEARRWNHHHLGTCRMGDDPATSVLDRDLRVHGADNLYVASSAAFVTGGVSNPTLTIAALSLRLADHLTARLRG